MRGGRRDAPTEASNSLDAPRREQWLSASHLIRLVRLEPWGTRLTRPGARDRPVRHDEAHVSLQYSSGHPRLVFELGITSAVTPVIPEEVPGFSILPRSGLGTSLSAESDRLLREGPRVRIPLPPAQSQRRTRGDRRSSGAFTHGLVRVLGAIVGPQPLLMTAGPGAEPGMRRQGSAACL